MQNRRWVVGLTLALVIVLCAGILPLGLAGNAQATSDDSLSNLGFEGGLTDWTDDPVADAALVVGTEGPSDFDTYADMDVTVEPLPGLFQKVDGQATQ